MVSAKRRRLRQTVTRVPFRDRFLKPGCFHGSAWRAFTTTPSERIDGSMRTMITELVGYHRLLQGRLPVGCEPRPSQPGFLDCFASLLTISTFLSCKSRSIVPRPLLHRPALSDVRSWLFSNIVSVVPVSLRLAVSCFSSSSLYSCSLATRNERSCFLSARRVPAAGRP